MTFEHKELTGTLFKNSYKTEGDNKPDYKGQCKIDGKTLDMSMWKGTTKDGSKILLSIKFQEPFNSESKASMKVPEKKQDNFESEPLPF